MSIPSANDIDFEIIDFHTHPFLREEDSICIYKDSAPLDAKGFGEKLSSAGISAFCGSVISLRGEGFERERNSNNDALSLMDMHGGRYIPGIQINPCFPEESIKEIDRAYQRGVRLVGELVPYFYSWKYSHEGLYDILDYSRKNIRLYSLHTIQGEDMERLVRDFPDIDFVFAHPGEKDTLLWHIELMKKYKNLYLDLSGTGLFRYGMLSRLTKEVSAERILFGSDLPICNAGMFIGGVLFEPITDREKELIFSENAKRLLNY